MLIVDLQLMHKNIHLTIIRYKTWQVPFAFMAMAIFRLPLWRNKNISFFKLMGSGKNGTFDKTPDLLQWAILTVRKNDATFNHKHFGSFIHQWHSFFGCETFTMQLQATEGHGFWDGQKCFGDLPKTSDYNGSIAVLTRATIRLSRMKNFWQHVDGVASQMAGSKGFITSLGIGEVPWIKQATFSVWQSKDDMKNFAYKLREHAEVVKLTHQEKWYSEDMFTRFKILAFEGTIKGQNPLANLTA
jgi:hypothetical protein